MAIRPIMKQGEACLNKKCHPVTKFDTKLHHLIDDMRETISEANGAGLAAPQVGILRRVVLVVNDEGEILELVNPELIDSAGEQESLEGCLSVPGVWGFVTRPTWAKVKSQDRSGNWFEVEGTEMTARCFCHELDHLDGKLYTELCGKLYTPDELAELEQEEEA